MKNQTYRSLALGFSFAFILLAGLSGFTPITQAATCTPPVAGLVSWWSGENSATDLVGNNHGSLQGGATYAPGKVGWGFRFDGTNGYVQIPDADSLKPATLTIEAWVWLDPSLPANRGGEQIMFKQNTWTAWFEGYGLAKGTIDNGDGTSSDHFQFCVSRSGNQVVINSRTIAQRGVWYHVAATYDGNQSVLYVNGVAEASATPGFALDYGTNPLFIGTSGTWPPYLSMFGGIIDEIAFYNRALTTNEIAAIYNADSAGKCNAHGALVPAITTISPTTGSIGTLVTITGSNFNSTAAANTVYFGAVRASVLTASTSQLTVTVPPGATFAPITVAHDGWVAASPKMFTPTFNGGGTNLSSSSFAPSFNLATGGGSGSCILADFDGDGKPDLALVSSDAHVISLYQNISTNGAPLSAASFAPRVDLPFPTNGTSGSAYRVRAVDLDGDGKLDLIACEVSGNRVSVFHNVATPGPLTANSFEPGFALLTGSDCRFVAAADLDGDSRADIVALNYGGNTISVFKNIGTPGTLTTNSFAPAIVLASPSGPYEIAIADLDGDGKPDFAIANSDSGTVSIFQNATVTGTISTNSFLPAFNLPAGVEVQSIVAVDVDGDGKLDLAVASIANDLVSLYRNVSQGGLLTTNSFAPRVDFGTPGWAHTVAVADFNGDGKPDLGVVGELPSYLSIFPNASTPGNFSASTLAARVDFGTGWNAWGIAAGDLDGDGRPDVVFCNTYDATVQIYQNIVPFGSPPVPPTILTQPTNLTVTVNSTAVLAVVAGGSPPLNYQWSCNGTNLSGATNATLTLNNVTPAQAGSYVVVVANAAGSLTSSNAVLTVVVPPSPPVIVAQSPSQIVLLGGTATFSVTASGSPPMNFFWSRNGTLIPAATNSSFFLSNAQLSDSGSKFNCLVTNAYGSVISTNISLKVIDTISNDLCSGAVVITNAIYTNAQSTLKASSFGDPLPDCVDGLGHGVWYQFTAPVSGLLYVDTFGSDFDTGLALFTGTCDDLTEVACNDDYNGVTSQVSLPTVAGTTYFILAGGYGSDAGNLVLHLNHLTPPAFAGQPTNISVIVSSNGNFSATLSGTTPISLQWFFNNAPVTDNGHFSGSTNAILNLTNVTTNDGGNYFLVASNLVGVTTSSVAVLTPVILPPTITLQPLSQSVLTGSNVFFTVNVAGTPPYNFQWYRNGNPLTDDGSHWLGTTTSSLSLSNVTTADAGNYTVQASNVSGTDTSTAASLTVLVPPVITVQPLGRSVPPGLPTTFTATASGIPAPSYQWQFNGTNISDANGASYSIGAVNTNQLGLYQVVAVNSVGSVTSAVAQLTFGPVAAWGRNLANEILPPPGLSNVVGLAGCYGASFAVRADGTIVAWGSGSITNLPTGASNVVAVAVAPGGLIGGAALRADGSVFNAGAPELPTALSNVVSVSVSDSRFGCALRSDGTVVSWGATPYSTVPAGLNHVTAIACGFYHSLALRNDGTVVGWGTGLGTNVPSSLTNVTAMAAGNTHSLALKANGTVVAWGSGNGTNLPAGLTNIVAVSASCSPQGQSLSLALRANGQVVAWGDSPFGETSPPAALSSLNVVAVAAAANHGLALVNNGSPQILQPPVGLTAYTGRDFALTATVVGAAPLSYQWLWNGRNISGATNVILSLLNLQLTNSGNYQLLASNAFGTALSLPAPVNVINGALRILSQIAASTTNLFQAGKFTVSGLTLQGSGPVNYQWFFSPTNKSYAAIAGATNATLTLDPALALNSGNYYLAASSLLGGVTSAPVNVRVMFARAWGYSAVTNPPVNVTNAIAVATGGSTGSIPGHYLVLGADGKVTAWGNGLTYYGETNVAALTNYFVTAIAASYQHSLALKSDGTVYAWGYGGNGQTNPPAGLSGVTAIACGGYHDLALKSDGTVVAWGDTLQAPIYGQATNNPAATNVVAIAAGSAHSLALRADGSVVSWGYPDTLITSATTNIVAIAAGNNFSVGLRADGRVTEWGSAISQYQVPTNLSNVVAIAAAGTHITALKNDGSVVSWGNGYSGLASNAVPADVTNVVQIASGGDHDFALLGTRAPQFTVQPWYRTIPNTQTSVWFSGKCVGVQPVSFQWQLNGTNLPAATNDTLTINASRLPTGALTSLASGVYQLIASNAYGMVTSKYAKLSVIIPLGVALNTTNTVYSNGTYSIGSWLNWTSAGAAQWFGQTNYSHDNISAARSGGIGGSQNSDLQTTLVTNVAGNLSFWWKVSSEPYFDTLDFRINGTVQTVISGEVNWQQLNFPIAAGTNVLLWRYSKDPTFDSGLDAGFVDQFAFTPLPSITQSPASLTVYAGTTANFSAYAVQTGQQNLSYHWQKNGVPLTNSGNISGANSPYLTLTSVQDADVAAYTVVITNNFGGSVTSSPAILTVLDSAPSIVNQTGNLTNYAGTAAALAANSIGAVPMNYSWLKNGTIISSGLVNGSISLNLPSVQDADAALYTAVVTNAFGSVTSAPIRLVVLDGPPVITNPPASVSVRPGQNATFAVAAIGSAALGYQWQFNGSTLPAATNATLTISNAQLTNAGPFQVVITNAYGAATSSVVTLTVLRSWVVAWGDDTYGQTNVPANLLEVQAISAGWRHNLALQNNHTVAAWGYNGNCAVGVPTGLTNVTAVSAGGGWGLALEANGTVVGLACDGVDASTHWQVSGLSNITAVAAGWYHWLALQNDGTLATYSVANDSYTPTNLPAGLTNITAIAAGDEFSVALKADGTVVAWGWNDYGQTNLPAGLSNVIAIAASSVADHALALKRDGTVVAWGSDYSGQTEVPAGLSNVVAIAVGQQHSLALKTDGTIVAWGTNRIYTVDPGMTQIPAGLSNVFAIAAGEMHSVALVNDGSPVIVRSPASQVANANASVAFSVTALGAPALAYQWQKNGVNLTDGGNLTGSTTASLTLSNVQPADIASYSVVITNAINAVTSSPASLLVAGPPVLLVQPLSQTVGANTSVGFTGVAIGYPAPAYQWWQNGTNPIGLNNSNLVLANVGRAQNGIYSVLASNAYGSVWSSNCVLKVLVPQKLGVPTILPDGSLQFISSDVNGGRLSVADLPHFEVQVSTDLVNWMPQGSLLILTNGTLLLHYSGDNSPIRFYRLIEH